MPNPTNNQILLNECIKQEYEESTGYSNENLFFEHFAASQILKNYNLSDEEIDNGNSGGANDGGCDNLYVFVNEELMTEDIVENIFGARGSTVDFIIIQSKKERSFGEDALMKWKTVSENLLDMAQDFNNFQSRYNEMTLERFALFNKIIRKLIRVQIKVNIYYYYVTMANEVHPNVSAQAEELKNVVRRFYPAANVEVKFVGADRLMELYNSDSEISIDLELADQPISLGNKNHVALVKLGTYFKFITDEQGMLRKTFFEANVRDYQGHNSVNTSISDTLNDNIKKEDFWWLNNGVTILASEVTLVTNRSLRLLNPEIVNGLQTSREIFNYFSENAEEVEKDNRHILIRVIKPDSEESRDSIIFATNNQTSIQKSYLRVTDTIHSQIELYFKSRGLYYDRRKNYYKNLKKKSKDIISVSFLAQCLISLLLRKPDFARARPSTLLTDDKTYKFLYEDNNDLEVYYKAACIGRSVQNCLKTSTVMNSTEVNDILFYVIYAIVAEHLQKKEISFDDIKNYDVNKITNSEVERISNIVYSKYKELGGNSSIAKSSVFIDEIDNLLNLNEK